MSYCTARYPGNPIISLEGVKIRRRKVEMDFGLRHFAEFAAFSSAGEHRRFPLLIPCSVHLPESRSYFGSSKLSFVRSALVKEKSSITWDITRNPL